MLHLGNGSSTKFPVEKDRKNRPISEEKNTGIISSYYSRNQWEKQGFCKKFFPEAEPEIFLRKTKKMLAFFKGVCYYG